MKEERRSVDTSFWTDPVVENLSKEATYLFNAMLTFPENNMAGVYEITEKKISYYTKLTLEEINSAFRELELQGKVFRYNHWIGIKNHIKNQKIANGNMAISIVKDLCKAPKEIKLWLYYKPNTEQLEEWFQTIVFKVNSYYGEQRRRAIIKAVNNKQVASEEEANRIYPEISISKDELIRITTEELPFHRNEISNFYNTLTLTQWLQGCSPNKNRNKKIEVEDRSRRVKGEVEYEDMNGYSDNHDSGGGVNDLIQDLIKASSKMKSITEFRGTVFELPRIGEVKNQLSRYTEEEVKQAFTNYEKIYLNQDRYRYFSYKDLSNFIIDGLPQFLDINEPFVKLSKNGGIQEEKQKRDKPDFSKIIDYTKVQPDDF
jgi:hypothetical protein